jgi:hypothetical protein
MRAQNWTLLILFFVLRAVKGFKAAPFLFYSMMSRD